MDNPDENIRHLADELMNMQNALLFEQQSAAYQRLSEQEQARIASEQHRSSVINLCGKFAVWASENKIRYNSPSLLAPGWLLGQGEGPPYYSYSHQGVQDGGGSGYSLLVRRSGSIHELVTSNAYRRHRRYHLFPSPHRVNYDRYPIHTIYQSIAEFSVNSGIPWYSN